MLPFNNSVAYSAHYIPRCVFSCSNFLHTLCDAFASSKFLVDLHKKTWSRYWDVSLATAEVQPPFISKANTFLQLLLMATSLTGSVYGFVDFWMMDLLRCLLMFNDRYSVAGTTIASALHYLFNANFRIKSRK